MDDKTKKLYSEVMDEVDEWIKDNKPQIPMLINSILNTKLTEIIAVLLGFDHSGGYWRIESCYDRKETSIVGEWLNETVKINLKKWLDEQTGNLPELPMKCIELLKTDYRETYEHNLRKMLKEKAMADARAKLLEIIDEIETLKKK